MKIQMETGSYNARRYGKPWIARVDFSTDPKGTFQFGEWVGQHGDSGLLLLEAEPGDVVSTGQKDYRGHNGTPVFRIVQPDGTLAPGITKAEAYKHSQARTQEPKIEPPQQPEIELLQKRDADAGKALADLATENKRLCDLLAKARTAFLVLEEWGKVPSAVVDLKRGIEELNSVL